MSPCDSVVRQHELSQNPGAFPRLREAGLAGHYVPFVVWDLGLKSAV